MTHAVRLLARPGVADGFRLAGLAAAAPADPRVAAETVAAALAGHEVGVLLVEEATHDALPEPVRREAARRAVPLVVPFPSPAWRAARAAPDAYIAELLREAIGYRVRLG